MGECRGLRGGGRWGARWPRARTAGSRRGRAAATRRVIGRLYCPHGTMPIRKSPLGPTATTEYWPRTFEPTGTIRTSDPPGYMLNRYTLGYGSGAVAFICP